MNIVEFLEARIAEDEEVANAAIHDGYGAIDWAGESGPTDVHIARNDPARILAECQAKRAIVDLHDQSGERWTGFPRADQHEYYCMHDQHSAPCSTLRILASVYAEHPTYDPAWR